MSDDHSPVCLHCGGPLSSPLSDQGTPSSNSSDQTLDHSKFCCRGCQAAYALVNGLGLSSYYQRRCIDPDVKFLRPEDDEIETDLSAHVQTEADGTQALFLMVEGIHCAACVWLIETVLGRQAGVVQARMNMTTRRLTLRWTPAEGVTANSLVEPITRIGYRLVPYDPAVLSLETIKHEKALLRYMAVSGFSAGNIMLLSVSIWAGVDMGEYTRDMFHWLSALIAFPTVAYTIRPFSRSAWGALRHGRTNMDVPICLGVSLALLMSLWETIHGGHHAYFDAAVTLLFFLLIGRYLDSRARGQARSAAEHLLALGAQAVTVLREDGTRAVLPPRMVQTGMTVLVAPGERIGVDGVVSEGRSDLDTSLITGETLPRLAEVGDRVFAGTLNLTSSLRLRVQAVGEGTLLAEIVRMMEVAEQGRALYVALADRVARYYAPVVHVMAALTFAGWMTFTDAPWQQALLTAVSVLIITCPCAIALAVPVVQVIASGRLLRRGILLKSATALERLTAIDTVVFDKTGTLTLGKPTLVTTQDGAQSPWSTEDLRFAAGMALHSRHPLSRALVASAQDAPLVEGVEELPGQGLIVRHPDGDIRLGNRVFCGLSAAADHQQVGPELWLARPGRPAVQFCFQDALRSDAAEVVTALKARGLTVELLSGDRAPTVAAVAESLGIIQWSAEATPADKCARLEALRTQGRRVLMVGDGLNDAPALATAEVSLSPSSAVDVSQTAADAVFQGDRLAPVLEILEVAKKSDQLVKGNFGLALAYNLVTIPMAVMGMVTPLIASIAMSSSSVIVIANAMRLVKGRRS